MLAVTGLLFSTTRTLSSLRFFHFRASKDMGRENLLSQVKKPVNFRLCNVSNHTAEVLEIKADDPKVHVLFVPGNPGVITFYKDFVESLYEYLGGNASITAIGHAAQTRKNLEPGRLFSLQEQIDHKMDFIRRELASIEVPIVLVGHSIGSHIVLEMLRRSSEKVIYCVGLYPFLEVNQQSVIQSIVGKIAVSSIASAAVSSAIASLGLLPSRALRFVVSKSLGWSWSATAIEATCTHLSQYHVMRNILFMAMTEFKKLAGPPDWAFMRENQGKLAFLYGVDDHWGPLEMYEEISKQAPDVALSIEKEGHTHSFCVTQPGSIWVASHVASLIKNKIASLKL